LYNTQRAPQAGGEVTLTVCVSPRITVAQPDSASAARAATEARASVFASTEARASVFATRPATNFMSSPLAPNGGRNISEALGSSSRSIREDVRKTDMRSIREDVRKTDMRSTRERVRKKEKQARACSAEKAAGRIFARTRTANRHPAAEFAGRAL
jgi:hypothetical protein